MGAAVLLIAAIVAFGSGALFKQRDKYVLYFNRSVKGLSTGAPVIFKGVKLGTVSEIDLVYDPQLQDELIEVTVDINFSRIRGGSKKADYQNLIQRGLRAKLDTQSFVTGQLMIAFAFYPKAPVVLHKVEKNYPELPTLPTPPDIFEVMDEVPIKEIADNLKQITDTLNKVTSSQGFAEIDRLIREITATSRAARLLMEYLEAHPEAFLKGKRSFKFKGE
jgi:paraquat-inducible protein B